MILGKTLESWCTRYPLIRALIALAEDIDAGITRALAELGGAGRMLVFGSFHAAERGLKHFASARDGQGDTL